MTVEVAVIAEAAVVAGAVTVAGAPVAGAVIAAGVQVAGTTMAGGTQVVEDILLEEVRREDRITGSPISRVVQRILTTITTVIVV